MPARAPTKADDGTVTRSGAICIACRTAVPLAYVRAEGKAGRISTRLMAIAAEGNRRRHYVTPTGEHESAARVPIPDGVPDTEIPHNPRYLTTPNYGMNHHSDLFTPRQLNALTTFSDLVAEARDRAVRDAVSAGLPAGAPLDAGGTDANAYADSISIYLGLAVSKIADIGNSLVRWKSSMDQAINLFTRQAIPMMWDFVEAPPFGNAAGSYLASLKNLIKVVERLGENRSADASQANAIDRSFDALVCTDPPYYDNVGYADLSDFFYVWLRRSLGSVLPSVLGTMLTPKDDELVADPFRRGGSEHVRRDTPPD